MQTQKGGRLSLLSHDRQGAGRQFVLRFLLSFFFLRFIPFKFGIMAINSLSHVSFTLLLCLHCCFPSREQAHYSDHFQAFREQDSMHRISDYSILLDTR